MHNFSGFHLLVPPLVGGAICMMTVIKVLCRWASYNWKSWHL